MNFLMHKKGFTLIELLVVIAVIGILSSIVIASLKQARDKNRYAQVLQDMQNVAKAAEEYASDNGGNYPLDAHATRAAPGLVPRYLSAWPTPPCSTLLYDWDRTVNASNTQIAKLNIRTASGVTPGFGYSYCVSPSSTQCSGATNFQTLANKTLSCP